MNKSSATVELVKPTEGPKRGLNKRQHQQPQQQIQHQQENQDVIKESGQLEINKINLASHKDTNNQNKQCKTDKGTTDESAIPAKSSNDIVQEMIFKDVQDILDNDLSCAICQDIYVNPLILNCSHSFCKFCVYKWLSKKKGCPQCRVRVTFQAENLALRNIINKMVSKSPIQFKETRDVVVKQRLNEEQKLEKDGLPPVLRKRDVRYDDDQYMGLENFANHINIRFLTEDQYYDESDDEYPAVTGRFSPRLDNEFVEDHDDVDEDDEDDDEDDDDDDDEDEDDSDGSDEGDGHRDMFEAWDDIEDSDDVSFHMNGDNSGDSNVSSDSEDEIIESDHEDESEDSSVLSSIINVGDEWPIEINGTSDDDSSSEVVDVDLDESSDVSMDPESENARCSDDSTVEYENDSEESVNDGEYYAEYFRSSDTEIDEDDYWD